MEVVKIFLEANWLPRSGPITLVQQVTVAFYLLTATLSCSLGWFIYSRRRKALFHYEAVFWLGLSVICLGLAANRSFNIQGALTTTLRMIAYQGYWYNIRKSVQEPVIIGVLLTFIILFFLLRWLAKPIWRQYKLVSVGLLVLVTLVTIRAVSLHQVDELLYRPMFGFHAHQLIELGAIAIVAFAILRRFRMIFPQHHLA